MAPRPYSMDRRSQQAAQTRDRIIDAAVQLFSEQGARATTMTAVGRKADVAPTTVFNHFATQELLVEAVIERLLVDVRAPDRTIFDGARSVTARLGVLSHEMFAFYERTSHWYYLLGDELTEVPAVARANAEFTRSMRELYDEALAGRGDGLLRKTLTGLIHPATFAALTSAGLSRDEAASVVADLLSSMARRSTR
jgi:AcrR family transcriptional regulator